MAKNYQGKSYTNKETGHQIQVLREGMNKAANPRASSDKIKALSALPQILENSKYINGKKPYNPQPGIKEYHYYDAAIIIGNKEKNFRIVVKETKDGHRFYDHIEDK